jgi:hypothetical protein
MIVRPALPSMLLPNAVYTRDNFLLLSSSDFCLLHTRPYTGLMSTDDNTSDILKPLYDGEGHVPNPPVAEDDPWGHRAYREAQNHPDRPQPENYEEYQLQIDQWLADNPVKLRPLGREDNEEAKKGFYKIEGQTKYADDKQTAHTTCPVCGAPPEKMPGCYVPYAGRRWDCFEMYGRNLTAEERVAYIEYLKKEPLLPATTLQWSPSSESNPSEEGSSEE